MVLGAQQVSFRHLVSVARHDHLIMTGSVDGACSSFPHYPPSEQIARSPRSNYQFDYLTKVSLINRLPVAFCRRTACVSVTSAIGILIYALSLPLLHTDGLEMPLPRSPHRSNTEGSIRCMRERHRIDFRYAFDKIRKFTVLNGTTANTFIAVSAEALKSDLHKDRDKKLHLDVLRELERC